MKTGSNIRLRKDGRYEARYIRERDKTGKIVYGYCYGATYEEAEAKRDIKLSRMCRMRELNLIILGAGSHGQEVKELAQSLRVFRKISFLDDIHPERAIGSCKDFEQYLDEYPVAIPAIGDTVVRMRWMKELVKAGFVIPTLIHPTAIVSPSAEIGNGTVIFSNATISPGVSVGKGSIISSSVTIARNMKLPDWFFADCGETINEWRLGELTK